jgi:hypothetical protein
LCDVRHSAAPQPGTRIAAIVQTSVFDAVNGITGRYSQFRPDLLGTPPSGASAPAAAVSAAYTALLALFPTQKAAFDAQLAASMAQITGREREDGGSRAIARGVAWGQSVANAIVAWRNGDGWNAVLPDYVAGTQPGDWQPQPGIVNPVFRQWAKMTQWTMTSPGQFDPGPPPTLTSTQFQTDLAQVRLLGNDPNPVYVATARFWQGAPGGDSVRRCGTGRPGRRRRAGAGRSRRTPASSRS